MIGINEERLDNLIRKNDLYSNTFSSECNKLISTINQLNDSYTGNDLKYLFNEPINQITNIKKITGIIKNYSDVLYGVKVSYQAESDNINSQINHLNSNL